MAKQHIYARVKKGIYTKRTGFDTAAVSFGLDEAYVKENVHRFCFYREHNFLDDENDIMPPIYFASHLKSLDSKYETLIFGKNSYVQNYRSSFISHSIIIESLEELEQAYENFDTILNFDNYLNDMDLKTLEDIDILKLNTLDLFFTRDLIFEYLGITKEIYCSILNYTILSIIKRKSLYIKLDCKRINASEMGRQLLRFIFFNVPDSLKKRLSFITYTPTLNLSNFFNIIFVDKKTPLDKLNNQYIFDFTKTNTFFNKEIYLDFAWSNIIHANKIIIKYGTHYKNIEIFLDNEQYIKLLNKSVLDDTESFKNIISKNIRDEKMLLRSKSAYFFYVILLIELYNLDKISPSLFFDLKKQIFMSKESFYKNFSLNNIFDYILNLLFNKVEQSELHEEYGKLFLIYDRYEDVYSSISNNINEMTNYKEFAIISYFYLSNLKNYFYDKKYDYLNKSLYDTIILKSNCFNEINISNNEKLDINEIKQSILKF